MWEDGKLLWEKSAWIWREVRGSMVAFGPEENDANCPIPTVLPAMDLTLTPDQQRYVSVRNGFALSNNPDGAMLGGVQGFAVRWQGVLLVEDAGTYRFGAGAPTAEGEESDFEAAKDQRGRVTLERGQKIWVLLSRDWPDTQAPAAYSAPLPLKRGAYRLTVEFIQPHPPFSERKHGPQTTGFQLKYSGPDTGDHMVTLPRDKLFRDRKHGTLAAAVDPISAAAKRFLETRFTSTLRDIRRSYQRAFKALLFAHRLDLSVRPVADDGQSEIEYLLAHSDNFAGTSYFRNPPGTSTFAVHKAYFDFNFLPLRDNYLPPVPAQDQRVQPSAKRQQALFDWWERGFDYTSLRSEVQTAPEQPVWLLFHEAARSIWIPHISSPIWTWTCSTRH